MPQLRHRPHLLLQIAGRGRVPVAPVPHADRAAGVGDVDALLQLDTYRFTTTPSFITNDTRSVAVMSASGLPGTAMMSASLPEVSVPTLSSTPRRAASTEVAARNAAAGDMPRPVIRANSLA